MKKLFALIMIISFLFVSVGCSSKNDTSNDVSKESSQQSSNEKKAKIGIIQITAHDALDASRQGFLDALKENGYEDGKNIEIDYQNAQGDQSNLKTIAQKFVNNKSDLILAIATPSAVTMAAETTEIPIVVTAVTDLVEAQLVKSNEKPETNITGTTDLTPVEKQFELIKKIVPDVKTVGVIYNSSEINSEVQVAIAKEVAKKLGLEIKVATVTNTNEVMQAAQSLVGKVQAFYSPTDNVVASSIASVVSVAEPNKIPFIVGESGMVRSGALATIGIDYYNLGKQTGLMAIDILKGKNPAEMPVQKLEDLELVINQLTADKLGITIPEELLKSAKEIIK